MRLVSFELDGRPRVGLVKGEGIVDLTERLASRPAGIKALLAGDLAEVQALADGPSDHRLDGVRLLPTVPDPDKVMCVGLNYRTHIAETGRPQPEKPMIFTRFANSFVGHGSPMVRPRASERLDFEGELAVVIGRAGRHISRERAFDHIAGYTCGNDGSVRDFQRHTTQYTPGKNFYHSGALGPWLVTADEAGRPEDMVLETRLNGEVVQHAPVSDLLFDVPELIAYCSTFTELVPGDVILSGTTGGVGAARTPPRWLVPGDRIEVEITPIGLLSNPVEDEPAA